MSHRKLPRRRGNAVLEAALVLPILLYLAFGTVEFGYFFYVKNQIQGAAREGVRAAITSTATNSDVTSAVSASMSAYGLSGSGYSVVISPSNVSGLAEGAAITVTVQCTWGSVGSGVRPLGMISTNKLVKGVAVMRKEG